MGFEPRQHTQVGLRLIYLSTKGNAGCGRDPRQIKTRFQTFNFKRIVWMVFEPRQHSTHQQNEVRHNPATFFLHSSNIVYKHCFLITLFVACSFTQQHTPPRPQSHTRPWPITSAPQPPGYLEVLFVQAHFHFAFSFPILPSFQESRKKRETRV